MLREFTLLNFNIVLMQLYVCLELNPDDRVGGPKVYFCLAFNTAPIVVLRDCELNKDIVLDRCLNIKKSVI